MGESKQDYQIEQEKYFILKKMCLRYWEQKQKIENITKAGGGGFMTYSKSAGRYSDPTANKALLIEQLNCDCKIIEKTINKVCADYDVKADERHLLKISDFLLLNVTTFHQYYSYRSLIRRGYKIAMGINQFYLLRHKFFYELSKKVKFTVCSGKSDANCAKVIL